MAIVVLPEGQQRSGKQGGIVWSRNRGGPYTRNRAVPVNPNTDRQNAIRVIVRNLAIAWNNVLTQAQRNAWELYADNVPWLNRLGETTHLTGLDHYIRSNTPLLQAGGTRVDDAPTIFTLAQAEGALVVTASEATQQLSVAFDDGHEWCDEDDAHEFVYMGQPVNASRKSYSTPWRYIGVIDGDSVTPPTTPVLIAAAWPFAQGQRIWVRTRIIRADGRLSEFAQVNFLGAA